jgi:hypothetical protein
MEDKNAQTLTRYFGSSYPGGILFKPEGRTCQDGKCTAD